MDIENENLEIKLNDIKKLFKLIENIKNDNKRFVLKHKMQTELDFMIDRIENYYYKYVLKNRNAKKIKTETEQMIYNSRKTIETFMPYILLYNITEQYGNEFN